MKVLVTGGTGNVGSRVIPAALQRNHQVTAYVRNKAKLEKTLPADIISKINIVEGSSLDEARLAEAMNGHDAAINCAGLAAMAPWGSSELPKIVKVFVEAAGKGLQGQKRVWVIGGLTCMSLDDKPDSKLIVNYLPLFPEHVQDFEYCKTRGTMLGLNWSFLCPSVMKPSAGNHAKVIGSATVNPLWQKSPIRGIPFIGPLVECMSNGSKYGITLEAAAEFMVAQLESNEFVGKKVGLIEESHKKAT